VEVFSTSYIYDWEVPVIFAEFTWPKLPGKLSGNVFNGLEKFKFSVVTADTIHVLFNVTCISFVFIISADGFMTQDLHHYA
jgi:hypothetical protein